MKIPKNNTIQRAVWACPLTLSEKGHNNGVLFRAQSGLCSQAPLEDGLLWHKRHFACLLDLVWGPQVDASHSPIALSHCTSLPAFTNITSNDLLRAKWASPEERPGMSWDYKRTQKFQSWNSSRNFLWGHEMGALELQFAAVWMVFLQAYLLDSDYNLPAQDTLAAATFSCLGGCFRGDRGHACAAGAPVARTCSLETLGPRAGNL